jgi:neutral trehalase
MVRIPVEKYEEFLLGLEKLGIPEHRTQTAQDVTEEFVDLEARIANKRKLEQRILQLVEDRDGKINDVIDVERELARVREEIERMEGRMRYLSNRAALTTVTITVREEKDYVPPQAPSFTSRIGTAWSEFESEFSKIREKYSGVHCGLFSLAGYLDSSDSCRLLGMETDTHQNN